MAGAIVNGLAIGKRMRRARLAKGMRLVDVAHRARYTKGFLSKIEHGRCSPPIATLLRVADAVGVDLADLLAPRPARSAPHATIHTKAAERLEVANVAAGPGYSYQALAASRGRKLMEPFVLVVRPEDVDTSRTFHHAGEEFLFVLKGRCDYRVGEETFDLKSGDSLYFDATKPHAPLPKGGPVTLLAVFMPHARARRMLSTKKTRRKTQAHE